MSRRSPDFSSIVLVYRRCTGPVDCHIVGDAMDEKHVPVLDCMDDLVQQLRVVFQSDSVNVDYVRALLAAYKSNPRDWKQYAIFDPYR